MNTKQILRKLYLKSPQQSPNILLPNQTVGIKNILQGTILQLVSADAIVGTGTDLSNGLATHTSLQAAHDSLVAGQKIRILKVTLSENITITKRLFIDGMYGYDSQLNGTFTINSGVQFMICRALRFGGTVTIQNGANGNQLRESFFATDQAGNNAGLGNILDGVIES